MLRFVCSIPDFEHTARYPAAVSRHHGEAVYGVRPHELVDFLVVAHFDAALAPQSMTVLYREDVVESKEAVINDGPEPKVRDNDGVGLMPALDDGFGAPPQWIIDPPRARWEWVIDNPQ